MADVDSKVRDFYEKHPYPLQQFSAKAQLIGGSHALVMGRILSCAGLGINDLEGMAVLDAGCGTGEKALFCQAKGANALGFDISRTSISIAKKNAANLGIGAKYVVSSFESFSAKRKFDLILCIGSLHHTKDAHANFLRMARLLAPDGKISLGLYNVYGRLGCRMHRYLLWHGEKDPERIMGKISAEKEKSNHRRAVLADRFASPHETYHSIEEVLGWFKEAGIAPVATFPQTRLNSKLNIRLSQLSWLAKNKGFFFIGGMKK